jgi:hypothetical protein
MPLCPLQRQINPVHLHLLVHLIITLFFELFLQSGLLTSCFQKTVRTFLLSHFPSTASPVTQYRNCNDKHKRLVFKFIPSSGSYLSTVVIWISLFNSLYNTKLYVQNGGTSFLIVHEIFLTLLLPVFLHLMYKMMRNYTRIIHDNFA